MRVSGCEGTILLIDDRIGSRELLPHFKSFDVRTEVCHLESADAAFVGYGPDGPIYIGIERKVISDLVASIRSKRLSGHQLAGLIENYDVSILLVEGIYRPGANGELETVTHWGWRPLYIGRQAVLYREVDNFITSMEEAGL